jgi:hypothetical protein
METEVVDLSGNSEATWDTSRDKNRKVSYVREFAVKVMYGFNWLRTGNNSRYCEYFDKLLAS